MPEPENPWAPVWAGWQAFGAAIKATLPPHILNAPDCHECDGDGGFIGAGVCKRCEGAGILVERTPC